jgi:hypothetical protein
VHDLDFPLKNKKKTTSTTFEKPFGQQFTPPPIDSNVFLQKFPSPFSFTTFT